MEISSRIPTEILVKFLQGEFLRKFDNYFLNCKADVSVIDDCNIQALFSVYAENFSSVYMDLVCEPGQ